MARAPETPRETDGTLVEAMDRLIRLRDRPDAPSLQAELDGWLARDADHRRAWAQACRTWQVMGDLPRRPDAVPEVVGSARAPQAQSRRRGRLGLAVAALAACLLLAFAPSLSLRWQADHVTETAEARRVVLADGSVAHLAPESAIASRFTGGRRTVRLLAGAGFFEVVPDAGRPFVVDAGGVQATAIGTAFEVALSGRAVSVGVESGTVGVRYDGTGGGLDARLGAGERIDVERESGATHRRAVGPGDIAAWRDGRLFVADATVGEVVERLRRYHAGWIVIADDGLAARRVNGLYDLRQPERALRALVQPSGGKVTQVTPLLTVLTRP